MRWPGGGSGLRWTLALGAPALLLALAWKRTDLQGGAALLSGAGPAVWLAVLPFALVLFLDALGFSLLLACAASGRVRLPDAIAARLAGEAVAQTVPSAALAGDAASAWLLNRRTGTPLGRAIGGLTVRRLLLAPGHGMALAVAAVAAASQPALPGTWVATLGAAGAALLAAAAAGARLVSREAPFSRLQAALNRSPRPWLRRWLRDGRVRLTEADHEAARLLSGRGWRRGTAALCFTLVYFAEAAETLLLLRLLGAALTPAQALAIEPLVSLVRALAFFVPAGLGVQDLGYVSLLQLLGVGNAASVGAAFVLLKRLRELVWTAGGWSLLLAADAQFTPADGGAPTELGRRPEAG